MTEGEKARKENNTKYKDGVHRNARLVVKNISFKATEDSFRDHFSKFGTVEEAKLLKSKDGRLIGTGFVHFTSVPMANKALAATNQKDFIGRRIIVSWAVPKHKYLKDEEQKNAINKLNDDLDDSKPEIKEEDSDNESTTATKDTGKKDKVRMNRNARLIVRNISFKATEETLKGHFEPYGTLQEVTLLKKPDGKLVGCGFVHFKNVPMAAKALESTNMKPFLGRPISVDWAVAKNKYMQHQVNQQIELEDQIKKEESDSDDETNPMNVSSDSLKEEVKSESEDESDDEKDEKVVKKNDESKSSDDESEDDSANEGSEADDDDEDEENDDEDNKNDVKPHMEKQRLKLNDAEDGCTVFLTNVPFSVDNDQLRTFAEATGPVVYALICVDANTEHSRGSGFVKFANKDDADTFLALSPDKLRLEGQVVQVKPALKKENLQKGSKKQPKDNRNLYLVKEGVVVAGTKAAVGVSASDMQKRLTLERTKTQALKNLNRFVSRYRLVVSNLPPRFDDGSLLRLVKKMSARDAKIVEARVMRDLRAPVGNDGKHPSKGFGFVMFTRHEDALACLRKLNNNPDIFDRNNRPIVSFSIEDRAALNARKKRLEKSVANNPMQKQDDNQQNTKNKNRKRKISAPDESYMKKRRFEKNPPKNSASGEVGRFVKRPKEENVKQKAREEDMDEYTGLTAKEGSQHKMRSNQKLRKQAELHKENVKMEKKKSKRSLKLRMAARERVKQPKQKINKNKSVKRNKHRNRNRRDIR